MIFNIVSSIFFYVSFIILKLQCSQSWGLHRQELVICLSTCQGSGLCRGTVETWTTEVLNPLEWNTLIFDLPHGGMTVKAATADLQMDK